MKNYLIICILFLLLVESQWNTVQGLAAENLDECAPALEHSFCVKNKLLIRCPAIIKPVCSFNGFEYKTYPNSCYMDQDQLCRQDPFVIVPNKCCPELAAGPEDAKLVFFQKS